MKTTKNGVISKANKAAKYINKSRFLIDNSVERIFDYPGNEAEIRDTQVLTKKDGNPSFILYVAYDNGDCWRVLADEFDSRAIYDGNENCQHSPQDCEYCPIVEGCDKVWDGGC